MPIEKLRPSFSFDEERIKQLKQIAPEAFADNLINWEVLKEALGNYLEDDEADVEHFGLFWPGKREARRMASIPSKGTLVPVYGEGLKRDGTPDTDGKNDSRNIFIEGENLEALKILQKSYAGRIKMIYIDPPYNTGKDFIYDDNFTEPLEEYLRRTGQIDEEGKPLTTNKKSDGRFHSKWLSMMYPRLKLARNLLRNDGVIFVSIDDNEAHNLRQIMNEIFGEENLVTQIVWQSRLSKQNDTDISTNHEYILVFARNRKISNRRLKESNFEQWFNKDEFALFPLPVTEEKYSNPDNDPRGPWKADPFDAPNIRPNLTYAIKNPNNGEEYWPPKGRHWRVEEEKFKELMKDNRIIFGKSGTSRPQLKVFYEEKKFWGEVTSTWFDGKTYGTITNATKELMELFDGEKVFDFPKPVSLIKELLRLSVQEGDIILDFFAGSGTTGHSVLEFSMEEKKDLSFLLIQMPELLEEESVAKKKFKLDTISEIAVERLKRISKKYRKNNGKDFGFKLMRLSYSNYSAWESYDGNDTNELLQLFERNETALVDNWKEKNLIVEILLLEGFPLDSNIEEIKEYYKNKVQQVTSDFCEHKLLVCLDKKVHSDTIKNLQLGGTDIFICLDNAITDEEKVTLADKGLIKTI